MAPIHDLLTENLDRLESLYDKGDAITGLPSGFVDLDELLSGLQPNALLVLGARPSMGKTALALGIATHAAIEAHRPVLVFSLEMGQLELTQRMLCAEARVDSKKVRNGNLTEADWGKIAHATGRLADAPIWIDDNPNLTIMEIRVEGPPPAQPTRRSRARRRRLPPAHDRPVQRREPPGRGLGDLPGAQDPGPRARVPGAGPLTALAWARDPRSRQASRCWPTCASPGASSRTPTS